MRYMIFPYTQNSEGAIAIAKELDGQRILREGSSFVPKADDVIINWGASDCPHPQALNHDNKGVLDKLTFFQRLKDKGLTPRFRTTAGTACALNYPVFCRTKLQGRDGAGIVVADNEAQLVSCKLFVEGVKKVAEYRVHVGRLPHGSVTVIGAQKKIHGQPHEGQDARVWTGESTHFVWTVGGAPAVIPPRVIDVAIEAFTHFPELAFGAFDVVDCGVGENKAYVLEINSAPMMTPETAKKYGNFFRKFAQVTAQATPQPVISAPTPAPTIIAAEIITPSLPPVPTTVQAVAVTPIKSYLQTALIGFVNDPADSDYQKGYEAALKELNVLVHAGQVS